MKEKKAIKELIIDTDIGTIEYVCLNDFREVKRIDDHNLLGRYLIDLYVELFSKNSDPIVGLEMHKKAIKLKFLKNYFKIQRHLDSSININYDKYYWMIPGFLSLNYETNGLMQTYQFFRLCMNLKDYKLSIVKTKNDTKLHAVPSLKKPLHTVSKKPYNDRVAHLEAVYPHLKELNSINTLKIFTRIGVTTDILSNGCMNAVLIKAQKDKVSNTFCIDQAFLQEIGKIAAITFEYQYVNPLSMKSIESDWGEGDPIKEQLAAFIPEDWFSTIMDRTLTLYQRWIYFISLLGALVWESTVLGNKQSEKFIKNIFQSIYDTKELENTIIIEKNNPRVLLNNQRTDDGEWELQRLICELNKDGKIFAKVSKDNVTSYDIGIWTKGKRKEGIIFTANEAKQLNDFLNQIFPVIDDRKKESKNKRRALIEEKKTQANIKKERIKKDVISGKESALTANIPPNEKLKIIQAEIKNKNNFDEYEGNSNKLMPHQKAACRLSEIYDRFAFYYDTGTGKTVLALDIIASKFRERDIRFLVISPKAIIQTAWMNDQKQFYPKMKLAPLSSNITTGYYQRLNRTWNELEGRSNFKDFLFYDDIQKGGKAKERQYMQGVIMGKADHYIINPETFIRRMDTFEKLKIQGLIVDESSILKNYSSKTSQAIRKFAQRCRCVYLLSGKPAPNNSMEYFSQMKIVAPEDFKESYESFKKKYFENDKGQIVFRTKGAQKIVSKRIAEHSIVVSKEDCLNLPDTTQIIRKITLDQKTMSMYESMYRDYFIQIEKKEKESKEQNTFFNVNTKLASLMKLRQVVSGFLMDGTSKDVTIIHKKREEELLNTIDEIGDQQVIIWCQFQYEISHLKEILTRRGKLVVTANSETKNLDTSIAMFKEGNADIILAHPKTLQYGVTFIKCTYAIYYSLSYSFEEYYQSHDRIYRIGQENKCTYIFLQVEDTIDEILYQCVMEKKNNAKVFEMLIKDAQRRKILR